MAPKSGHISVVQFSAHSISVFKAKVSAKGVRTIDHFIRRGGPWSSKDGSLQNALRETASEHGLAESEVASIIPRHEATVRVLQLPSRDPVEIAGMVSLSAPDLVPYSPEEIVVSSCILQARPDGESDVLVAVVHNEVVHEQLRILRAAGLEPKHILLSTACLLTALRAAEYEHDGCFALANLASEGLEVLVMRGENLEYTRGVATVQDWNTLEGPQSPALDDLSTEVRISLSTHGRATEDGVSADSLYLSSDCTEVDDAIRAVSRELELTCKSAENFLGENFKSTDASKHVPLVALGAALCISTQAQTTIDLLPKDVIAKRETSATRRTALRLGLAAVVMVMSVVGVYAQAVYMRTSYIAELERRVDVIRPKVKDVRAKSQQLKRVQKQVDREGTVLELLAAVCNLAPAQGLNISRFAYRHDDSITIQGRSITLRNLDAWLDDIRAAGRGSIPQFARAQEMYRTQRRERYQEVWDFSIAVPFPEAEGEDGDA